MNLLRSLTERMRGGFSLKLSRLAGVALVLSSLVVLLPESHGKAEDWLVKGRVELKRGWADAAALSFRKAIKSKRNLADSLLGLGKALKMSGKFASAVPVFRQVLELRPDDQEASVELAEILSWKQATRDEALMLLRRTLRLHPEDIRARRLLGITASWSKGTWQEAIDQLQEVVAARPLDREAVIALANVLFWSGNPAGAAAHLDKYLEKEPWDKAVRYQLAKILSVRPDTQQRALAELTELLKSSPGNIEARLLRARLMVLLGSTAKALPELRELAASHPLDVQVTGTLDGEERPLPALLVLAQALMWAGSDGEAEACLRKYLKVRPEDAAVRRELATMLSHLPDRRKEALSEFDLVLKQTPEDRLARFRRALTLAWTGDYPKALASLKDLAAQDPYHPVLMQKGEPARLCPKLALAVILTWAGRLDEAESELRQYLESPAGVDDRPAKVELAQLLSYKEEKRKEALAILNSVLAENPADERALKVRGRTLLWLKQYDRARADFEEALRLKPGAHQTEKELATALRLDGQKDRALVLFQRVWERDPADADALDAIAADLLARQRAEEAERLYRSAIDQSAQNAALYVGLSRVLAFQGRFEQSRAALERGISLKGDMDLAAIAEDFSGAEYLRPLAVLLCQRSLAADNTNTRALFVLGRIQVWRDSTRREGIKTLQAYLKLKPDDRQAATILAEAESWLGRRKEALVMYDKLLSTGSAADQDILALRAQVLSWMGKIDAAKRQYRLVLNANPDHRRALVGLGQCLNWAGDHLQAEKFLSKAREIYPNDSEIAFESALNFLAMGRLDKAFKYADLSIRSGSPQ